MEKTWKEKYQAKLDATPATKALNSLKSKMEPLRKKVVTAMAVKDMATTKVKAVESRVKDLGKKVAEPVVKIKDATGKGISAISGKMKELGTKVVIPVAIAAATATTAVVGASVSEGAKLEQSRGGVETLFKDDADTVKANADKAFETAGLSANDYMEQVTSFSASLLNSLKGDTAKAATVADQAMMSAKSSFGTPISLSILLIVCCVEPTFSTNPVCVRCFASLSSLTLFFIAFSSLFTFILSKKAPSNTNNRVYRYFICGILFLYFCR